MTDAALFTDDFAEQPHWWDLAAPEPCEEGAVPPACDVAIVGSGYTSLVAALHLARAGRSVLVLEAQEAGHGASRRNAGYLGRTLKRSFTWLEQHHGREFATRVYRELDAARQWIWSLVAELGIECHIAQCGRFIGATSRAHYDDLARELEAMQQRLGFPYEMIAPTDVRRELASDAYMGGAVIPDLGAIHPALYHHGLLQAARTAGVRIFTHTPVTSLARDGGEVRVVTTRGTNRDARSNRRHQRLHAALSVVAGAARRPVRRVHGRDGGAAVCLDRQAHPPRADGDRQQRQHQFHPPGARCQEDPVRRADRQPAA